MVFIPLFFEGRLLLLLSVRSERMHWRKKGNEEKKNTRRTQETTFRKNMNFMDYQNFSIRYSKHAKKFIRKKLELLSEDI